MARTYLHVPRVELVAADDLIASCNVCGVANYLAVVPDRGSEPVRYESTGLKLWDLKISPNGYQTTVTKVCGHCLVILRDTLSGVAEAITHPEDPPTCPRCDSVLVDGVCHGGVGSEPCTYRKEA